MTLRPAILDDLGLPAALRSLLAGRLRDTDVKVNLTAWEAPVRLPFEIETACYRLVQEAITNVLRHSQASHVWVDLRHSSGELEVRVRDDGIGFDAPLALDPAHLGECLGLAGMRDRITLAGGSLHISSTLGAGAEVVAVFSLPKGEAA